MSFLEHLDELRTRLTISAIAVVVGFLIAFAFSSSVFDFIMKPLQAALPPGGKLVYTEPAEAFLLYLKIAALAGAVIAAPVVIWQLWLFIAPGLYQHEKRYAIPFVLLSSFFFVCGAAFSHFLVFPFAWRFFASFNSDYVQFMPRIAPAFSLYSKLMLAMGGVFQMPTLVFFLARMGVVSGRMLFRYTKYAILVIFIVAAIITPGPDVVSQCLVAAPMLLLYAISIVIAWAFGKKRTEDVAATPHAEP
jgi:sec-independent protein translocase protein TatC